MKTSDLQMQRSFNLLGCLMLIGSLLYLGRPVLIPVTIAILLTFILAPLAARLEYAGVPRFLSCTIAVFAAAVIVVGIVHMFTLQARSLVAEIPTYKLQIKEKIVNLRQATAESWVADVVEFSNELLGKTEEEAKEDQKGQSLVSSMNISLLAILQSVASTALEILFNFVLVLVLALLMLMRREDMRYRLLHLLGTDDLITATRTMDDASKRISRFLVSQLVLNIGFGAVIGVGLYFIDVPYAYVWGAMAAVLRYIPFLGGWIAAASPLLASLVQPDWTPFFLTGAFFIIAELVQANFIEPQVFGHSIGVSGAGQLIAVLFWGALWGPVGLIVATPLTACACVLGGHFTGLRFIAKLIGDAEVVEKPAAFYQRLLAGDIIEASLLVEEFIKEHDIAEVYDALLLPTLVSAERDHKSGDLSRDDQTAITDAVREIYQETVLPKEAEIRAARGGASEADSLARVLAVDFPFRSDTDEVVVEMLREATRSAAWSVIPAANVQSVDEEPTHILLATSHEKNLARIRGMCKTIRDKYPDATIVVCCWSLENDRDVMAKRLKEAGAAIVCSTFAQAREIITSASDHVAKPPSEHAIREAGSAAEKRAASIR